MAKRDDDKKPITNRAHSRDDRPVGQPNGGGEGERQPSPIVSKDHPRSGTEGDADEMQAGLGVADDMSDAGDTFTSGAWAEGGPKP